MRKLLRAAQRGKREMMVPFPFFMMFRGREGICILQDNLSQTRAKMIEMRNQ